MKCIFKTCEKEAVEDGLCEAHHAEYRMRNKRPRCPKCGRTLIGFYALEAGECFSGCEDRKETALASYRLTKKGAKRCREKEEDVVKVER